MSESEATARHRQIESLNQLRALSSSAYITSSAAECLAAAVVCSPPMFFWYMVEGALGARFPRQLPGIPTPAVPQTFGGLLSHGLRYSASSTVRTGAWFAGTGALSASFREVAKVGPRYQSGPASIQAPVVLLLNGASGSIVASLAMLGWNITPSRRGFYVALGGLGGIALPVFLGVFGPVVRLRLSRLLPQQLQKDGGARPPELETPAASSPQPPVVLAGDGGAGGVATGKESLKTEKSQLR